MMFFSNFHDKRGIDKNWNSSLATFYESVTILSLWSHPFSHTSKSLQGLSKRAFSEEIFLRCKVWL